MEGEAAATKAADDEARAARRAKAKQQMEEKDMEEKIAKLADDAEAKEVADELGLEVAGGFEKTQRELAITYFVYHLLIASDTVI